ncbi:MAG: hypothetical protein ACXADY_12325 [Candidatus Hodarchaeales archaeon]|jgi:hypothetical protein
MPPKKKPKFIQIYPISLYINLETLDSDNNNRELLDQFKIIDNRDFSLHIAPTLTEEPSHTFIVGLSETGGMDIIDLAVMYNEIFTTYEQELYLKDVYNDFNALILDLHDRFFFYKEEDVQEITREESLEKFLSFVPEPILSFFGQSILFYKSFQFS